MLLCLGHPTCLSQISQGRPDLHPAAVDKAELAIGYQALHQRLRALGLLRPPAREEGLAGAQAGHHGIMPMHVSCYGLAIGWD